MHEVFQAVIIDLQAFDGQFTLERVRVELSYLIVIDVQLFQLLQILQTVNFHYLIPRCLQYFEFGQLTEVEAIEILK
jgi:hypothetical protein